MRPWQRLLLAELACRWGQEEGRWDVAQTVCACLDASETVARSVRGNGTLEQAIKSFAWHAGPPPAVDRRIFSEGARRDADVVNDEELTSQHAVMEGIIDVAGIIDLFCYEIRGQRKVMPDAFARLVKVHASRTSSSAALSLELPDRTGACTINRPLITMHD